MGWKDWILPTLLGGTLVAVPATDAAKHPLDSKKHSHTHVEAEYTHVGSSGTIFFSTGASGTRHYVLHAEPGSYLVVGKDAKLTHEAN